MRSTDPSPWADDSPQFEEMGSTAELRAISEEENRRRIMQERTEQAIWERFAPRMTVKGDFVR